GPPGGQDCQRRSISKNLLGGNGPVWPLVAAESGTESALQDRGSWSRTSGAPGPGSVPPARAAAGAAVRQYRVRASVAVVLENLYRPPPGRALPPRFACPSVAAASHSAPPPYRIARAVAAVPDASALPPGADAPGQAPGCPGAEQYRLARQTDRSGPRRRRGNRVVGMARFRAYSPFLHPHLAQAPGPRPGWQSSGSPATALGAQSADGGADAGWYSALQTIGSRVL